MLINRKVELNSNFEVDKRVNLTLIRWRLYLKKSSKHKVVRV